MPTCPTRNNNHPRQKTVTYISALVSLNTECCFADDSETIVHPSECLLSAFPDILPFALPEFEAQLTASTSSANPGAPSKDAGLSSPAVVDSRVAPCIPGRRGALLSWHLVLELSRRYCPSMGVWMNECASTAQGIRFAVLVTPMSPSLSPKLRMVYPAAAVIFIALWPSHSSNAASSSIFDQQDCFFYIIRDHHPIFRN